MVFKVSFCERQLKLPSPLLSQYSGLYLALVNVVGSYHTTAVATLMWRHVDCLQAAVDRKVVFGSDADRLLNPDVSRWRNVGQKVWRDQAPTSVEFSHEESVVVHFAEDEDEVAGPEGQLDLAVNVGGELVRVVVVEGEFPSGKMICFEEGAKYGKKREP